MRSNVCRIEKGSKDLAAILKESEKVAVYNELTHKQALHLRLLCEELDGMLPELVGDFEGKFWIEYEDGLCKVNASIEIDEISTERKEELLNVAKSKKNASAVGVVGKIRSAIENFLLDLDAAGMYMPPEHSVGSASAQYMDMAYTQYWSLNQYKSSAKSQNSSEAWDELEKSVIASVADDVIVGIKGKRADIIIVKKFG